MSRDAALWTSILAGPVVWLLSFVANFALAPWACVFQAKVALYFVSLLALGLAAASGMLGWRQWSALGKELAGDGEGALPRSRVMAISGILLSAMFSLVIVAQAIPELVLGACE